MSQILFRNQIWIISRHRERMSNVTNKKAVFDTGVIWNQIQNFGTKWTCWQSPIWKNRPIFYPGYCRFIAKYELFPQTFFNAILGQIDFVNRPQIFRKMICRLWDEQTQPAIEVSSMATSFIFIERSSSTTALAFLRAAFLPSWAWIVLSILVTRFTLKRGVTENTLQYRNGLWTDKSRGRIP